MAIINAAVAQGTELQAVAGGTTYVADRSLFKLGGLHITQQLAIGIIGGLLVGALWKA